VLGHFHDQTVLARVEFGAVEVKGHQLSSRMIADICRP
jgi:hypothetical protein